MSLGGQVLCICGALALAACDRASASERSDTNTTPSAHDGTSQGADRAGASPGDSVPDAQGLPSEEPGSATGMSGTRRTDTGNPGSTGRPRRDARHGMEATGTGTTGTGGPDQGSASGTGSPAGADTSGTVP
jgi:hypothetical protein